MQGVHLAKQVERGLTRCRDCHRQTPQVATQPQRELPVAQRRRQAGVSRLQVKLGLQGPLPVQGQAAGAVQFAEIATRDPQRRQAQVMAGPASLKVDPLQ